MAKILWNVREAGDMTAELWQRFKDKATSEGKSPTDALAALMRRYLGESGETSESSKSSTRA